MKNNKNNTGTQSKTHKKKARFYAFFVILSTVILSFFASFQFPALFKAGIWDSDVVISRPVGTDILPGGNMDVNEDIESSFIFTKLIPFAIDYGIKLAIGLSVVILIYAGYQFMTAYGNTDKQGAAKKTAIYALIGLVLALTAYGIVVILTSIELS